MDETTQIQNQSYPSEIMKIPKQGPVIAIDGPAGTGKSSVTKRLGEVLGYTQVDTGALYRAIAFLTLERIAKKSPEDKAEEEFLVATDLAKTVHLEFIRDPAQNPSNRIFANGRDLTDFIRTLEVGMASSRVSAFPAVRAALLGLQRRLGCRGKTILEGRDIGTVVFPDADVKFFLNATLDERTKRRLIELEAAGKDAPSFDEMKKQIHARDQGDSTRAVAPLKKAEGAIEVDTSNLTLDEVVDFMAQLIQKRQNKAK